MQDNPFDAFMDEVPLPIAILDAQLRFVKANPAMLDAHGIPPEAYLARP